MPDRLEARECLARRGAWRSRRDALPSVSAPMPLACPLRRRLHPYTPDSDRQGATVPDTLEAFESVALAARRVGSVQPGPGANAVTMMGEALEATIRDAYAGILLDDGGADASTRQRRYSRTFSWLGNHTNPPDAMIRGGDAIEVKKTKSTANAIQLNSSNPKDRIWSDDPRIAQGAVQAEAWTQRDLVYWVGAVDDRRLNGLWVVYGDVYCASRDVYSRVARLVERSVATLEGVELAETNELARLNRVDPLGITNLRVRGMWTISHPSLVFNRPDVVGLGGGALRLLCREEKWQTFDRSCRQRVSAPNSGFTVRDVQLPNPNNPAQAVAAKVVSHGL